MQKKHKSKNIISSCATALLIAVVLTIAAGYLCGYRAILVNGWSAEPHISYQSLIVTYRCKFQDLKVGDFITFSYTGKSYITHQITSIDYENDKIICQGWRYNSETQEYEHQDDTQVMQYKNVVGKVIFSNYIIGKSIFIIKGNMLILIGLFALIVITFIVKEEFSIEPEFE